MLDESAYKNDFYQLTNFYQPQMNPLYCAVATSVMLLNALNYGLIPNQESLSVKKPSALGLGEMEFRLYSQLTFLNEKTDEIKDRDIILLKKAKKITANGEEIYDPGFSLSEISQVLEKVYELKTKLTYADVVSEEKLAGFRSSLKKYLLDKQNFLVVNFDGKMIGLKSRGHVVPLVAFDEKSDSVLILDPALHHNFWFWVSLPDLYKAMNSKDGDNYRGYLVVRK